MIPHAIVELLINREQTPAEAWRTHLNLTQGDVAERMGITQSAYAQLEGSNRLRKSSRERIAAALGIQAAQLDI